MVGGEADVSMRDHKALEGFEDMVLVCAAARGPMGKAAASEGYDPCPHVMPYGCKASVVSSIVVRRRGVKRVEVNMGQRAMSAKAER